MKMLRCIRGVCDAPMQRCKASTLNPARSYRESGPETLIYIYTRVNSISFVRAKQRVFRENVRSLAAWQ